MGKIEITADKVKVFAKQHDLQGGGTFTSYAIQLATKKPDGTWVNAYQPVRFKKGVNLVNKSIININSAFPTFDPNKPQYPYWFVMDFTIVEDGNPINLDNMGDLPFA